MKGLLRNKRKPDQWCTRMYIRLIWNMSARRFGIWIWKASDISPIWQMTSNEIANSPQICTKFLSSKTTFKLPRGRLLSKCGVFAVSAHGKRKVTLVPTLCNFCWTEHFPNWETSQNQQIWATYVYLESCKFGKNMIVWVFEKITYNITILWLNVKQLNN